MIQTTVNNDPKDIQKMIETLNKFGSDEKSNAIIKSLKEAQQLYLSALTHLSKAYILYQPTTVRYFKENKITNFWAITASSLYDSGVMYICGLLDEGDIKHKNLRTLIKNIDLLKQKPNNTPILGQQVEEIYKRLKTYRNKKLAHYQYSKDIPYYWKDPVIVVGIINRYLIDFYSVYFDTEFLLDTLRNESENECSNVCRSIGISNLEKNIKGEIVNFFMNTEGEIKWQ